MKCTILHESRGRMRVHVNAVRMTLHRADVLEAYLTRQINSIALNTVITARTGAGRNSLWNARNTTKLTKRSWYSWLILRLSAEVTSESSSGLSNL